MHKKTTKMFGGLLKLVMLVIASFASLVVAYGQLGYKFDASTLSSKAGGVGVGYNGSTGGTHGMGYFAKKITDSGLYQYNRADFLNGAITIGPGASQYLGTISLFGKSASCLGNVNGGPAFTTAPAIASVQDTVNWFFNFGGDCFITLKRSGTYKHMLSIGGERIISPSVVVPAGVVLNGSSLSGISLDGWQLRMTYSFGSLK
jgi:hypothetical protein